MVDTKMDKELIFVYDWVGPLGPLNNFKVPDIYDLMKKMPYTEWKSVSETDEHDPIVLELQKHTKCRIVPSFDFESIGDNPFFYEILLSPKKSYVDITLSSFIGVMETVPLNKKVLDAIRNGQGYILLTTRYESFIDDYTFNKIHSYFEEHQIPLKQVVYLTNCANGQEIYKNFCEKYNIQDRLLCEYIGLYLLDQKSICQDPIFINRTDSRYPREKVFLNFNRRHRSHRYAILLKFFENDLLKFSHMSFSKDVPVEHWVHDTRRVIQNYDIKITTDDLYKVYDSLPFVLDSHNFSRFPVEDRLEDTTVWYDKTYLSLVSETNFESNIIHMTEKTIKPIIFKQPFIIVGSANTLKYLKFLGFKTFSDFWDEGYDQDLDYKSRMLKIVKICKKLSKWTHHEWLSFYNNTREIREHNFNNLANLEPIELNNFVKKYGVLKE